MILFLIVAAAMALMTALVLVYALRRARPVLMDRERLSVAIYRERLAELDAERDGGRIDAAQHAALLVELQGMLAADVDLDTALLSAKSQGSARPVLPWLLLFSVPVLSFAIYGLTGFKAEIRAWLQLADESVDVLALPAQLPAPLPATATEAQRRALLDAARLTQSTLQRRPQDAADWHRLGMAWLELDVPMLALESLRVAQRLAPADNEYMVTLARVELALNDGKLNDEIRALFDAVLQREPQHQGVLMVYGMAAFDSGDFAVAAARWQAVLAQLDPASAGADLLRRSIAAANARTLIPTPGTPSTPSTSAEALMPVQIVLASAWAAVPDSLPASAALFVVVRAAGGPPMPLAVRKLPPVLPAQLVLSDADQMVPGAPLATRGPLELRARLSLSGSPMPAAGDIESEAVRVELPLAAPVKLTLSKRLP